jgi:hypothetical protein
MPFVCSKCRRSTSNWNVSRVPGLCLDCLAIDEAGTVKVEDARTNAPNTEHSMLGSSLIRFLRGEIGLARTYWIYGVLAGFPWAIFIATVSREFAEPATSAAALMAFAYFALVYVAVWNASSQYTGPSIWRALAKVAVLCTSIPIVVTLLSRVLAITGAN